MILNEMKIYFRFLKIYIYIAILIMLLFFYYGYIFFQEFPEESKKLIDSIGDSFLPQKDLSSLELFLFIFENNVRILSLSLFFSFIASLSSLFIAVTNSIILGIFAGYVSEEISWKYFIAGTFPHGILELSAFVLTVAVGLKIGRTAILSLIGKSAGFIKEFSLGIMFFTIVIVPMLFVAALIETFITPIVLSFFA